MDPKGVMKHWKDILKYVILWNIMKDCIKIYLGLEAVYRRSRKTFEIDSHRTTDGKDSQG